MKKLVVIAIAFCFSACSLFTGDRASEPGKSSNSNTASPSASLNAPSNNAPADPVGEKAVTKQDCEAIDTGDNALLKEQTFRFDFEPFKNSCFVTSYNPEFDDPPMESEIAIYKGEKKIFDFPSQFNGIETGCWIEAVSFQDLNNDTLTDIIVLGKCSAKSAPYNENVFYVNTGKAFITDETANYKLADFKKASDITNFVKKNQSTFFK